MASGGYGPVLRQVDRLLGVHGTASGLGEGALLRRFADGRDEAAFEALVTRHGPMVLGTCRRILADPHDVDDAFQATFLVLARKAGSIRDGDRLGPWLHGVARRVATRSRTLSARRAARERPGAEERASAGADPSELVELRAALDEELARLPEKYRAPLVLCYLEGLTHDEAAVQLSWPVGTVRSRLARGRDRLRSRLTRRGLSPSAAVPAILPAPAIPEVLISSTVRIATAAGSAPAHVASLAKGALIAMMWHKLRGIAAVGLLAGLAVGGVGVAAQRGGDAGAVAPPPSRESAGKPPARAGDLEVELTGARKEIERLEAELKAARTVAAGLQRQQDAARARVPFSPTVAVSPKPSFNTPPADPFALREASPMVLNLRGGDYVLVIPTGLDRATVLNTKTGDRKTCLLPGKLTEVTPIIGNGLIPRLMALGFKGPEIPRIAVFDFEAGEWSTQDLRDPAKGQLDPIIDYSEAVYQSGRSLYYYIGKAMKWGILEAKGATVIAPNDGEGVRAPILKGPEIAQVVVMDSLTGECFSHDLREPFGGTLTPIVGQSMAAYWAGRFVYAFSIAAKKWDVLELKGRARSMDIHREDRKLVIPVGDLIHVFRADTGEWTHIDTKDDK